MHPAIFLFTILSISYEIICCNVNGYSLRKCQGLW